MVHWIEDGATATSLLKPKQVPVYGGERNFAPRGGSIAGNPAYNQADLGSNRDRYQPTAAEIALWEGVVPGRKSSEKTKPKRKIVFDPRQWPHKFRQWVAKSR